MIQNIIFDFDGVICESVNIKTEAFYELYLPYGVEIANKVKEHHIANGGMSRYDKFSFYEKTFLGKALTSKRMEELSKQFSMCVKEKIIQAPFVKGAYQFLEKHHNDYQCFIISATPIDEMREIAKEKNIAPFFKEILGSPKNKIEWLRDTIKKYHIDTNETLFIGDALSDYNAASYHHTSFLLRNTPENLLLFENKNIDKVDTLENLHQYIMTNINYSMSPCTHQVE